MFLNKRILKNIFSQSGIQLANYVLPLISIPYIVRVIGPDKFGLVNFAQTFINYFVLIISYGFDLSATRKISLQRNNIAEVSATFYSTIYSKILLFIISSIIFIPALLFFDKFSAEKSLYLYTYAILIGGILFPTWLYMGFEHLTRIALFNFFIKLIFTVSIFVFVRRADDYLFIPLSQALGQLSVGVIAFIIAIKTYKLVFIPPQISLVVAELKDGFTTFSSNIMINLYTNTNVFLLGIFTNDTYVGYYVAAEKIKYIVQSLILIPISQSLYPYFGYKMAESREEGIKELRKISRVISIGLFFISLIILLFSKYIILIIFGPQFEKAIITLQIIAFIPFMNSLGNIFGIQGLLNFHMDKEYLKITVLSAILNLGLNLLLIPVFSYNGTAFAWLITAIFTTAGFYYILRKNNIRLI